MRKAWFSFTQAPDLGSLVNAFRHEPCFVDLHNTKTAKQTIRKLLVDWTSFRKAIRSYKTHPSSFLIPPKPPGYKKKLAEVTFYRETIKKRPHLAGIITPTNKCFAVASRRDFQQVVIVPKSFGFTIEVQYEVSPPPAPTVFKTRACAIDLGLNNLAAITSDRHRPILINGRIAKTLNRWKSGSTKSVRKRYWRLQNYFHHVSKMIVSHCLHHGIGTIIIGRNVGWKKRLKSSRIFRTMPFADLIGKIQYKAALVGIDVVFTEEAYTSKASYLDRDPLPTFDEEPPEFSGQRIHRGMYRSAEGVLVNADVNGSANIFRKLIGNEDILLRLDRSLAARPVAVNPLKIPLEKSGTVVARTS